MYELFKTLVNAAAFDRLFAFCRRAASRLVNRLKRAGIRATRHILETAQSVLSWIRRIGAILGRGLMRPFNPIRAAFRQIVLASHLRLKPASHVAAPVSSKRKFGTNGRPYNGHVTV